MDENVKLFKKLYLNRKKKLYLPITMLEFYFKNILEHKKMYMHLIIAGCD